nr:receptor-like protein kinase 5 [Ipomoea batatas]
MILARPFASSWRFLIFLLTGLLGGIPAGISRPERAKRTQLAGVVSKMALSLQEIGQPPQSEVLVLSQNSFSSTGNPTESAANHLRIATTLEGTSESGNANLSLVDISNNSFQGEIPTWDFLGAILVFFRASNKLFTVTIPQQLKALQI